MDTAKSIPKGTAFTTGANNFGSIIENIFLTSDGFAILMYDLDAWFLRRDPNHGDPLLCMALDQQHFPYHYNKTNDYFKMILRFIASSNVKKAYDTITHKTDWIQKPKKIPDTQMFTNPIWSTWAEYKKDINQSKVLDFAREIKKHGFPVSQIEIDDLWERRYGDFTFDPVKFPNVTGMIEELHKMGYRVTLWVYPFVNPDSVAFNESTPYLVKNKEGKPAGTSWWDGAVAGHVDFSNLKAIDWFVKR